MRRNMWLLWGMFVAASLLISPSYEIDEKRLLGERSNQYKNTLPSFAFKYEFYNPLTLLSLTGAIPTEDPEGAEMNEQFQYRSLLVAYPDDKDIAIEMFVPGSLSQGDNKNAIACLNGFSFQLPCICYEDDWKKDAVDPRYASTIGGSVFYCGRGRSMVCVDPFREYISGNPSALKDVNELKTEVNNGKRFKIGVSTDKSLRVKFTFELDKVSLISEVDAEEGVEGKIDIIPMKIHHAHEMYGSQKYKVIRVLPFQILDPECKIRWTFPNGKLMDFSQNSPVFNSTDDEEQQYFILENKAEEEAAAAFKKL